MILSVIDWLIICAYFVISLAIGIWASKQAGEDTKSFFLAGRNMPWWLLGVSMVATTFSTDTPNLVTDLVRQNGVSGNWAWWAFLLTGMLTVFVYAKLWRRSGVLTDIEFYELRYSGKAAAFLRGFRALYLGLIFNVLVMGAVSLAAVKFGEIVLGLPGWMTLTIACSITLAYSTLGGLKAVIITDFVQFTLAMIGSVWGMFYILGLPEIGGVSKLISHPNVTDKIALIPDLSDPNLWVPVLMVPLAVQWWASYYPGAEPGGGGYIAQRMLAAKDENHAIGATLFFNILHYALRPWPWILVALASLVVFPDIASIHEAFPQVAESKLGNDLAYSAMLTKLPSGLLGLVLASLIAAYMSTISTHLNWGSSYIVNDFYKQYVEKDASEKKLVNVGRISTVLLMAVSALFALALTNATQIFDIIIMFGAGTGLIFLLRWFWWRINAWSEISAMFSSGIISILFNFTGVGIWLFGGTDDVTGATLEGLMPSYLLYPFIVLITSIVWITVTFMTPPESKKTLFSFYRKIQPGGPGWEKTIKDAEAENEQIIVKSEKWNVPAGIKATILGLFMIYGALFATGYWIYGKYTPAIILTIIVIISAFMLKRFWSKIKAVVF